MTFLQAATSRAPGQSSRAPGQATTRAAGARRALPAGRHSHQARRRADRGMVKRIDLDRLGAGRRARDAARPHQAGDRPAGVPERLRRLVAEPAAGSEHQNARVHGWR